MDYHRIVSRLFVGSYPENAAEIERLRRESGVTAVLNLQTDDDMRHFGLDRDSLLDCYRSCGIELRRIPVRDFDAVDLRDKLPACVSALNDLLESGHTVYLHCSAGAGRSPTVAIAYLSWRRGWELDRAVAHVTQCRPCFPNIEAIRLCSPDR
ncbi:MAG TPA: dual specificity protein phosphatase family protein [candidate division Zixibacteria bacterium]|nr:dual specificity protein phosphatase family protein [candidate division Zixibacteria bacterium]